MNNKVLYYIMYTCFAFDNEPKPTHLLGSEQEREPTQNSIRFMTVTENVGSGTSYL